MMKRKHAFGLIAVTILAWSFIAFVFVLIFSGCSPALIAESFEPVAIVKSGRVWQELDMTDADSVIVITAAGTYRISIKDGTINGTNYFFHHDHGQSLDADGREPNKF